jgi:hypothetical protein
MRHHVKLSAVISFIFALTAQLTADDWDGFRGPQGNPVSTSNLPLEWDVEKGMNIGWKLDLPGRGVSGPIVVGNRLFVTASGGVNQKRLFVLCLGDRTYIQPSNQRQCCSDTGIRRQATIRVLFIQ